jgi:hypothetical protein
MSVKLQRHEAPGGHKAVEGPLLLISKAIYVPCCFKENYGGGEPKVNMKHCPGSLPEESDERQNRRTAKFNLLPVTSMSTKVSL